MKTTSLTTRELTAPRLLTGFHVILLASMALPFLAHFLPVWGEVPVGARFLPIFLAPLIAALHSRHGLAFALAAITPWISHLLTGRPMAGMAVLLTVELVVFTGWLCLLIKQAGLRWWLGPAAYLLAKPLSGLFLLAWPGLISGFSFGTHLSAAVTRSWPGILGLAIIGFLILRVTAARSPDGSGDGTAC